MNRAFMATVVAAVVGWGLATGTGVAMAAGALPEGPVGIVGVAGVAGPAGPTGRTGPEGPRGEKGLGGDSGFWRDLTSDPAVAGTDWTDSRLRTALLKAGHSACGALDRGASTSQVLGIETTIDPSVLHAIVEAAVHNICPQYEDQL
jgi:hypothetical protein